MKKGFCLVVCLMLLTSLSGCWSRHEPKTLALVNSAIYDLNDTGGYQITIEVINPAAQGGPSTDGSGKSPIITAVGQGVAISEAIRGVADSLERTIFGGQSQVRFFSERLARKGVSPLLDFVMRDHLTDESAFVVVIQGGEPEQIYSSTLGLSDAVGDYIAALSDTQPGITSKSVFATTLDFVKDYYKEGKQPVCGVVKLVECETMPSKNAAGSDSAEGSESEQQGGSDINYRILYAGLAAFKNGSLVGYMDEIEARAYNFLTNNTDIAVLSVGPEDEQAAVIVHDAKADIKTEMQNGLVTADVKITSYMEIVQYNGTLDLNKSEVLQEIEAAFNELLAGEIIAAIKKAQTEFQSDIFGFGVSMHRQHPEIWRNIKDEWDDYFAKMAVNVWVDLTVDRLGDLKQSFRWESGK